MIKLNNINKKYNNIEVLKDINISFREKEFVSILGPSGSGKSTLLNIISAIEIPDEGELFLGSIDILKLSKKKLDYYRSNYINYIFQNYNLINYLNVKDNLLISSKLTGYKRGFKSINNILNKLKINKLIKISTNKLSGGEQQRVAIARSLIGNKKILLCDEPTGALDNVNSHKVMNILQKLSRDKLVIVVTHNEELAKKYSSRIIRIKDGSISEDTKPYYQINNLQYNFEKNKLSFFDTLKISFKNLSTKKIRTYLTTLAFSIGLISLTLVLSMSSGFNKEIVKFEKNSLYNYPLIISKERIDLSNTFKIETTPYKEGIINVTKNDSLLVTNNINEKLLNDVKNIDEKLVEGISYYKNINSTIKDYLFVNPNNEFFELMEGHYPNDEEVLLLLDHNKSLSEVLSLYLNINEVKYEEVLNKEIIINKKIFKISGVVISNNNYFKDLSGIIYNSEIFSEEINEIYIFPKNYKSKTLIKNSLKNYNIVDDSEAVINMTKSFISGISYILISFSIISLFVSIIMIAIITYISVLERYREIGILKSLGATSNDIKKLFLSENLIIGLLSSILTLEISNSLSKIINHYVYSKIDIQNIILINNEIIVFIIILSILLSFISGLIPARIASKKKIVDILKYE